MPLYRYVYPSTTIVSTMFSCNTHETRFRGETCYFLISCTFICISCLNKKIVLVFVFVDGHDRAITSAILMMFDDIWLLTCPCYAARYGDDGIVLMNATGSPPSLRRRWHWHQCWWCHQQWRGQNSTRLLHQYIIAVSIACPQSNHIWVSVQYIPTRSSPAIHIWPHFLIGRVVRTEKHVYLGTMMYWFFQ